MRFFIRGNAPSPTKKNGSVVFDPGNFSTGGKFNLLSTIARFRSHLSKIPPSEDEP